MKNAAAFCNTLESFLDFLAGICEEEGISTEFLKRHRNTVSMFRSYERAKTYMPTAMGNQLDSAVKLFFFQGDTSKWGMSVIDKDLGGFMSDVANIHKFTGRLLNEFETTLSNGQTITEAERILRNLKFIEVVVTDEVKASVPDDLDNEKLKQVIEELKNIELQQARQVEAVAVKFETENREKVSQASHLSERQKRRRGLSEFQKPPAHLLLSQSCNMNSQDQEQEDSTCTSSLSSTQLEDSFVPGGCDTRCDETVSQ